MKNKIAFLLIQISFFVQVSFGQVEGVSISATTEQPHSSAMLDVKSQSKGILIPTMLESDMFAILNPKHGLMVFVDDNDDSKDGFYFYDGNVDQWKKLGGDGLWNLSNTNEIYANKNIGIFTNDPREKMEIKIDHGYIRIGSDDLYLLLGMDSKHNIIESKGESLLINYYDNEGVYMPDGTSFASDRSLKQDISKIKSSISLLKQIEGVSYQLKKDVEKREKRKYFGVIAQDVEKILPDLVSEVNVPDQKQPLKAVNYKGFIPLLIEAVKVQQTEIETYQRKIQVQDKQIEKMNRRLNAIEKLLKNKKG